VRYAVLVMLAGCGNDLPSTGTCAVAPTNGVPDVMPVPLIGGPAGFDDLRFSPELGKVVAAPEGTGRIFLVDPDSLATVELSSPDGSSADANATTVFATDNVANRIVAIDIATNQIVATRDIEGNIDYVRYAPSTDEVWVTVPQLDRIAVLDAATLALVDQVALPVAPEGLTMDTSGHAWTQGSSKVIGVDVANRTVIAEGSDGCGFSHGFPQVDEGYGLVIGGCHAGGGIAVLTTAGKLLHGFEAGGGAALLAHDPIRHHLFVRGDPGGTLAILGVCRDGGLAVLASVPISERGHGATVDDRGHAWIADATTGGILRVTDPFPSTE
jgi:hypothetical protein